jgi:hypothetical protein
MTTAAIPPAINDHCGNSSGNSIGLNCRSDKISALGILSPPRISSDGAEWMVKSNAQAGATRDQSGGGDQA